MKTWKSLLAFVLVLGAFLAFGTGSASAAKKKNELNWEIKEGVLIISGKGEMTDYEGTEAPWRAKDKKAKKVKSITVETGVTHVGQQAFQYCEYAKSASLSDSVTSIGEAAFYGCKRLKTVRLPRELDEDGLGVSAFDHCRALKSAMIPEGVAVISNAAFNCCDALEWVYIPDSVEEIEDSAFNHCIKLTDVYYGGSWSDWEEIEISTYNEWLVEADIHFNISPDWCAENIE